MPHTVIHKLNELMKLEFPSQLDCPHPFLGQGPQNLPDQVLDLVDDIAQEACKVLGVKRTLTAAELRTMADAGYPVTQDGSTLRGTCAWKSHVIRTPRGLINYS